MKSQLPHLANERLRVANYKQLIADLQNQLDLMHKEVVQRKQARWQREQQQHARHTSPPDFQVGDYVKKATDIAHDGNKLLATYRGLYVIVAKRDNWIFRIKDVINSRESQAHASQLKFYAGEETELTEELVEYAIHSQAGFEVQALRAICYNDEQDQWEIQVRWHGFTQADNTWEPLLTLAEDCPRLVKTFLNSNKVTREQKVQICVTLEKGSVGNI